MIIVHDIFVCKPGNASKLAKMFKEWAEVRPVKNTTVMTDLVGQYHKVVVVATYESLAAYEEDMKKMGQGSEAEKALMEKFKDMNEMYISGSREMYKAW